MSDRRPLFVAAPGLGWPGLVEALEARRADGLEVASMREVRSAAVEAQPSALVYAAPSVPSEPDRAFALCAEAPIAIAAAALELGVPAVLITSPETLGVRAEDERPQPGTGEGEALERGETFLLRAAGGRGLVVRAGPVVSSDPSDWPTTVPHGFACALSDRELGSALGDLLEGGATGVVHLPGPREPPQASFRRMAEAIGVEAPPVGLGTGWVFELGRARLFGWTGPARSDRSDLGRRPGAGGERLSAVAPAPLAGVLESAPAPADGVEAVAAAPVPLAPGWDHRGPPAGRTPVLPGVAVLRLAPGERASVGSAGACGLVLRTGKVLVEVPDADDRVARAGTRLDLSGAEAPRATIAAVDASEVWIVVSRGRAE